MGCCFSRQNGPNSPYPGGAPSASSARAIIPRPSTPPGQTTTVTTPGAPNQRLRHLRQPPLSQHINKPLKKHRWRAKDSRWTRTTIDQQRIEFFDTRVTGRLEVWQTIRAVLEVLWEADVTSRREATEIYRDMADIEADIAVALATAQSILDAADITLPTGNLKNGVYDSLGNFYSLPEYVVCDPENLYLDTDETKDVKGGMTDNDGTGDDVELDEDELEQRREEKGKGLAIAEEQVKVCARLSDDARDIALTIGKGRSVKVLVRRIAEAAELPRETRIRIAYLGKILKDDLPLTEQGWQPGHVINAFMFEQHR